MIIIPGATVENNRIAAGLMRVDNSLDVRETPGIVMRGNIVVDFIDLVKEYDDSYLFNDVMIRIRGKVQSLTCDSLPGANTAATFVFDEPKYINDEEDLGQSSSEIRSDGYPSVNFNTEMPSVTIFEKLSRDELSQLCSKGGHVAGYQDYATAFLSQEYGGQVLTNIPLMVTFVDASPYVCMLDINGPHNSVFTRSDTGYDFVKALPMSEEMQHNYNDILIHTDEITPENVIQGTSRADLYDELELLELEDEDTLDNSVTKQISEMLDDVEDTKPAIDMSDPDAPFVVGVINNIRDNEISTNASQIITEQSFEDILESDDLFEDVLSDIDEKSVEDEKDTDITLDDAASTVFDIISNTDNDILNINVDDSDITEATFDSLGDDSDTIDDEFVDDLFEDSSDFNEEYEDEDEDTGKKKTSRKLAQKNAMLDMANDGVTTIADAQMNKKKSEPKVQDKSADDAKTMSDVAVNTKQTDEHGGLGA